MQKLLVLFSLLAFTKIMAHEHYDAASLKFCNPALAANAAPVNHDHLASSAEPTQEIVSKPQIDLFSASTDPVALRRLPH